MQKQHFSRLVESMQQMDEIVRGERLGTGHEIAHRPGARVTANHPERSARSAQSTCDIKVCLSRVASTAEPPAVKSPSSAECEYLCVSVAATGSPKCTARAMSNEIAREDSGYA